jgi:hypothetical protein
MITSREFWRVIFEYITTFLLHTVYYTNSQFIMLFIVECFMKLRNLPSKEMEISRLKLNVICHEGTEGDFSCSSTLSLTWALEAGGWVVNITPRPFFPLE